MTKKEILIKIEYDENEIYENCIRYLNNFGMKKELDPQGFEKELNLLYENSCNYKILTQGIEKVFYETKNIEKVVDEEFNLTYYISIPKEEQDSLFLQITRVNGLSMFSTYILPLEVLNFCVALKEKNFDELNIGQLVNANQEQQSNIEQLIEQKVITNYDYDSETKTYNNVSTHTGRVLNLWGNHRLINITTVKQDNGIVIYTHSGYSIESKNYLMVETNSIPNALLKWIQNYHSKVLEKTTQKAQTKINEMNDKAIENRIAELQKELKDLKKEQKKNKKGAN